MKIIGIGETTRSNMQGRVKRKNHTEKDQRTENHTVVIKHINTKKIKKGKRSKSIVKEKKIRSLDLVVVVLKIRTTKESPLTGTGIERMMSRPKKVRKIKNVISTKQVIRVIEINIKLTMSATAYMVIKESLNTKVKKNIQEANTTICPVLTCSLNQVWKIKKRRQALGRDREMLLRKILLLNIQRC